MKRGGLEAMKKEARIANLIDKTGFPQGPWNDEPDFVMWRTKAGLWGVAARTSFGNLNGYVQVPSEHPWYRVHYVTLSSNVTAHGGLTFSGEMRAPTDAVSLDGWWIGFDCAHFHDYVPSFASDVSWLRQEGVYRDFDYVTSEVEAIAVQVVLAGKGGSQK